MTIPDIRNPVPPDKPTALATKLRAGRFSYHPTGGALDYKVNNLSPSERQNLLWYVKRWLGDGFDALLHGASAHLHVEYDPKD